MSTGLESTSSKAKSVRFNKPFIGSKSKDDQLMNRVVDQLAQDLKKILSSSTQIKNRLRILSEKMEIDKKTLIRLSEKGSKPNYITVFKIYRYLLNEVDDAKLLSLCPEVIQTYLKNANPQNLEKKVSYTAGIDKELKSNPIFAEIYILCATGPISLKEVELRFGLYGKNVLQNMLKLGVVAKTNQNEFTLGLQQTTLTPESIISLGTQLTLNYAKVDVAYEMDHNIMGFYAEGLTDEAYRQWLLIDQEAIRRKISLAQLPASKGSKRAFTFAVTDTLDMKDLKK